MTEREVWDEVWDEVKRIARAYPAKVVMAKQHPRIDTAPLFYGTPRLSKQEAFGLIIVDHLGLLR